MVFIDAGDEVFLMDPVFDLYVYLVELAGGIIRYVPIPPPAGADSAVKSGDEWTVDIQGLGDAISSED
ncbi:hypothetical protein IMSHALPRED_002597 [Imshaugia aleurites]|uniref:Uncharacterized protein n=1 Tax=Imshaugia aleurites TaxID=172621 RepID=A0A8H3F6X8_9LECA|nr:hypothetical protein IMSHALPRED_002597 [Imshaugia aleurites]